MRQNLEPEQTARPVPLASANESESANSLVSEGQTQTEEMEAVLAVLAQQSRLNMRYSSISAVLFLLLAYYLVVGAFIYLFMSLDHGHAAKLILDFGTTLLGVTINHGTGHPEVTVNPMLPLLLLGGGGACTARARRASRKLTSTLKRYQNVRAVGPFVEALFVRDKAVRAQAAANLTHLLPRLRREDTYLLHPSQRRMLSFYLGRGRWNLVLDDDQLSLAILNAYWYIGDGTELPTVRRLAQGKVGSARDGPVREAAQQYLDEVQRRKEEETRPYTLLRASSGTAVAPDVLLRPAAEATESDPRQLLRADTRQHKTANDPEEKIGA